MNISLLFLLFFSGIALLSALMVIISKNPIHSVLFLILVFFCSAAIFLLLQVEFIGIIFLMIYVGAISVLFLFVIMMLNIKITEMNETIARYLPIGLIIGFVFLIELLMLLNLDLDFISLSTFNLLSKELVVSSNQYIDWFSLLSSVSNIEVLGLMLYNYHFIYFLIGGMILLLAMIGTIVLTLNSPALIKRQNISDQLYSLNKVCMVKFIDKTNSIK